VNVAVAVASTLKSPSPYLASAIAVCHSQTASEGIPRVILSSARSGVVVIVGSLNRLTMEVLETLKQAHRVCLGICNSGRELELL